MSDSDAVEPGRNDNFWRAIVQFAVKTLIVGVVITGCLLYLIDSVVSDVSDMIDVQIARLHEAKFSGRAFWANLERALDRAAAPDNALSPERQQKLLADIHILAERARPFVAEAASVFSVTPPPPPASK
jgi:hypothetical protein